MFCFKAWYRNFPALLMIVALSIFASHPVQSQTIFAPLPTPETPVDMLSVLRDKKLLSAGQTINDLPPERQAAIRAAEVAYNTPSMANSVALLAHFETLSDKEAGPFRLALINAALPAFLMADAAKFELIIETTKRLHEQKTSVNGEHGIAVSIRVGSTGKRLAQYLQWVDAGRPTNTDWTFKDPFGKAPDVKFTGMPIDPAYLETKLFNADDDITNWATKAARDADPLANEKLNGKAAAAVFAEVAHGHLKILPEAAKANLPGQNTRLNPSIMQVEFLSPTKAISLMANAKTRAKQGWSADLPIRQHVGFLGAKVLVETEKYNGLYAEEQLHAWGMAKGYVVEDVLNPRTSAKTYADSASSGKLKTIVGSNVFPTGHMDPFGWMATNYRQIFVTHKGDLDSVAKYTLRMIDWWENVGLSAKDLKNLAKDTPGIDAATLGSLTDLAKMASAIRNADTEAAKVKAIKDGGGKEAALAKLKDLNKLMMLTGQRKHLAQMSAALTDILRQDVAKRTLGDRLKKPLDFGEILAQASKRDRGNGDLSDPYVAFRTMVDAYANGYANLPEEVARDMALDIAQRFDSDILLPGGKGQISAEMRLILIPVLHESTQRARAVGNDLRADAAGLTAFAAIANSELAASINEKLARLNEPDLHGYLARLQQGKITRRQLRLAPIKAGGWPGIRVVQQVWTPADIAADTQRIMWLGEHLGWSDATFAHRLAAYFNGPEYRVPTLPGSDPPGKRAYADAALEGFLGLTKMLDGVKKVTRTISQLDPVGAPVTRELIGTHLADPALNMALITFEHTVRGAEAAQKIWGLKGDVESLYNFGKTLKALTVPSPDMDRAAKAKMLATLAAESYGSFSAVVQNFGTKEWTDWMDVHMGGNSTVLGKFGGTVGVALATADDAFQSPESRQALYGALITDLVILWQPNVAAFMAANSMYQAGKHYYVTEGAKSDLIDLMVANGNWEFSSNGAPPLLKSIKIGDRVIADDAKARAAQCRQRQNSSILPKGQSISVVGLHALLKLPPENEKNGVPLCTKRDDGTLSCETSGARLVKPREAALTLFDGSGFKGNDPIILAIKDSINARIAWYTVIDPLRIFLFDDGTSWGAERLGQQGIFPPTPEDSPFVLREKIALKTKPSDYAQRPRDKEASGINVGLWANMSGGGRKMLGYTASEYWVRRQYLLECVMFDPLIQEAGRKALKDDYKDVEIGDIAGKLAALDERMRALDKRFWPNIAASYQPYPIDAANPTHDAAQKLAIYAHYLGATSNHRIDLRDLITWFSGPQNPENLPMAIVARAWQDQYEGIGADTKDAASFFAAMRVDNTEGMRFSTIMLRSHIENMLIEITDIVVKYEDGFDNTLKKIAETVKYAAAADGLSISPVHVDVMLDIAYNPPGGKFGPVKDHLFPKGAWVKGGLFSYDAENSLLNSLSRTGFDVAIDGSVGANLREWKRAYGQVRTDAHDKLAESIAPHQITLVDEVKARVTVAYNDSTEPYEAMLGSYTEDLAKAHPLLPRILRQEFQNHKIALVEARKDRVFDPELKTVLAAFKTDGNKDAAAPDASIDGLAALTTAYAKAAQRLYDRADNLFYITAKTPDDKRINNIDKSVAETLATVFKAEPFQGEDDPKITQAEVDSWISEVYWELARDPEFKGPIARPSVDAAGDISFLPGVAKRPDTSTTTVEQPEKTPPLLSCDASKPDAHYESIVAIIRANADENHSAEIPLVSPGNFYLRATALGRQGVPLARRTLIFEVKPAEFRGRLIFKGDPLDQSTGRRVEVNVGGVAWYRNDAPTLHPSFALYQSGLFRSQLCGALSQILLQDETVPPQLFAPDEIGDELLATGYYYPRPKATAGEVTGSDPVKTALIAPGIFGALAPIEIILETAQSVPVSIEAYDAANLKITPDDSKITLAETDFPGPSPIPMDLAEADILTASASLEVLGGSVQETSDPAVFSVADHADGLILRVDLPAYAKGNLQITGGFKLPTGMANLGGISGGIMYSNLLPDDGDDVLGTRFGFSNADPVALDNGLVLEGVLYASDTIETLLRASMPRREMLPTGGVLDLGEIEVSPYATSPVEVKISLKDWANAPLNSQVEVTLDGVPLTIKDGAFTGSASFEGRAQKLLIRAEFSMEGGPAFVEHDITISDIGDPLNPTSPPLFDLRVPVYNTGSLQLIGSSSFVETALSGKTPSVEFQLGFQGQPTKNTFTANVGELFSFDPTFPIKVKDLLQITGKTRADRTSFKGELTALAPQNANGQPSILDLGEMRLEAFTDLIQVPNLKDLTVEEAKKLIGDDFVLLDHATTDAPTPSDAGKIFVQSPPPHSAAKPSLVPRGLYLNVGVYRKPNILAMPRLIGTDGQAAESLLAGMGFTNITLSKGRAALDGEQAGIVASQSPPQGTAVDPKTAAVTLIVFAEPVLTTARAEPEPPEPPEEPPEPEKSEPPKEPPEPEEEDPPTPPVVTADDQPAVVGSWVGKIKLLSIDAHGAEKDFSLGLTCSSAERCATDWIKAMTDTLAEEAKVLDQTDNDSAWDWDLLEGLGAAITIAASYIGPAVLELGFEGIGYSLVVGVDENGVVSLLTPEGENSLNPFIEMLTLSINENGEIEMLFEQDLSDDKSTGHGSFIGLLTATETGINLRIELKANTRSATGNANGTIIVGGDFTRGEAIASPFTEALFTPYMAYIEKPMPKYAHLYGRLKAIERRMIDREYLPNPDD